MSGNYHRWQPAEELLIRAGYERGTPVDDLAAQIGVPDTAVRNRARILRLKHRRANRTLSERFLDYVLPEPNSGCWLWTGSYDRKGYGQLRMATGGPKSLRPATHISLELVGKSVPLGMQACHTCDVPACVNPDHLFIGTPRQNTADMIRKGRHSKPPLNKEGRRLKDFCHRGHPLSGDNLLISPGRRWCRACSIIWKAARRERRRDRGLPRAAQ